jgi:hypothetical protein
MTDDDSIKQIPIGDLRTEPEAEDLLESAAMEPYLNLAMAVMGGKDTSPAIEGLAALALEKRYVWRVASALKWAFVDFETLIEVQARSGGIVIVRAKRHSIGEGRPILLWGGRRLRHGS